MSLFLNIDTSQEIAFASLADNSNTIDFLENPTPQHHGAFLHTAIYNILKKNSLKLSEIDAIGVNTGPGSYTGIRIGVAGAKGLGFSLDKPVVAINSLYLMANAVQHLAHLQDFICPMIDARRLEVFSALYTQDLTEIKPPQASIITDNIFFAETGVHKTLVTGSGAAKFMNLAAKDRFYYQPLPSLVEPMAHLIHQLYTTGKYTTAAGLTAAYTKDFFEG